MAEYRVPELDLSTRINIGLEMLQSTEQREWGRVTELAQTHGVSRTLLYRIRDQMKAAIIESLAPTAPGPQTRPLFWVQPKSSAGPIGASTGEC